MEVGWREDRVGLEVSEVTVVIVTTPSEYSERLISEWALGASARTRDAQA